MCLGLQEFVGREEQIQGTDLSAQKEHCILDVVGRHSVRGWGGGEQQALTQVSELGLVVLATFECADMEGEQRQLQQPTVAVAVAWPGTRQGE